MGLRQDDLPSPLLFVFIIEAFHKMITGLMEDGFLSRFVMG